MDRSILRELWSWSKSFTNLSFCNRATNTVRDIDAAGGKTNGKESYAVERHVHVQTN